MLKEIIEKITNEMMCPEARSFASKLANKSGTVTIVCKSSGEEFSVESDDSVIGGWISAKDSNGGLVDIDLCKNKDYKFK